MVYNAFMTQPQTPRTPKKDGPSEGICKRVGCGVSFVRSRSWQKYCSPKCRQGAWTQRRPAHITLRPGESITVSVGVEETP